MSNITDTESRATPSKDAPPSSGKAAWRNGRTPFTKIRTALNGILYAFNNDFSARYKMIVSMIIVLFSFYLRQWVDVVLILLATSHVLTAELQNTAIEELCDFVEDRHNERIKIIKDVGAGSTATPILLWYGLILYEYYGLIKRFILWLM